MRLRPTALPPLIILVLWAGAVWWPLRSATESEQQRLVDIQSDQLSLVATIGELNAAGDRLAAFEADLERMAVAIPSTLDMPGLIGQLDAEADESGVQIDLLAPGEVLGGTARDSKRPLPTGISSVTLTMGGQGSFEAAMDFVDRLDALPRLIVVDVFGLSAVDGDARQIIFDLELRVFTTEALAAQEGGFTFSADAGSDDDDEVDDLVQPWIGQEEPPDGSSGEQSP